MNSKDELRALREKIEVLQDEVKMQNDCLWVEGILRQYDNEEVRVLTSRVGWLLGGKGEAEAGVEVGAKQTQA